MCPCTAAQLQPNTLKNAPCSQALGDCPGRPIPSHTAQVHLLGPSSSVTPSGHFQTRWAALPGSGEHDSVSPSQLSLDCGGSAPGDEAREPLVSVTRRAETARSSGQTGVLPPAPQPETERRQHHPLDTRPCADAASSPLPKDHPFHCGM